jgi:type I restriction enzyme, S subunit
MLTHRHDTIIGDIPDDWHPKPLRSLLAKQFSGEWGSDEGERAVSVLRSTNFTSSGALDFSDVATRYFSQDKAETFGLQKGDLLVERSGGGPDQPVGRIGFITEDIPDGTVSNFVQVLRPDPVKVDPDFLGWVLYELQRTGIIERVQQQSTQMRNLNWRDYQRLLLPWPEPDEQRRIAAALKLAGDAIAKAKAELEATRELKRSLMFELLMPSKNENWQSTTFGTLVREKIRNGYSPSCPQDPTGAWVLSLDALNDDGFNPDGIKPAPVGDDGLLPFRLEVDDILISRSNTPELVGRSGRYVGQPEVAYYPDLMMRIRVNHALVTPAFAELLLRGLKARRWLKSRASGTSGSMVKIKRRDIMSLPVLLPSPERQAEIVSVIFAAQDASLAVENKLLSLQQVKKSLLQNLLTGKIRIPEGAIHG